MSGSDEATPPGDRPSTPGPPPPPPPRRVPNPLTPPPVAEPIPPSSARPLRTRAGFAQGAVGLNLIATVVTMYAAWNERRVLVDLRNGVDVEFTKLEATDDLTAIAAALFLLSLVAGAVAFIVWFHRAYKNVATRRDVQWKTGWAIGGWFVPILNLARPLQIAEVIAAECTGPRAASTRRLVNVWWALFLLSGLADRVLLRPDRSTIDGAILGDTLTLLVDLVWIAAGVAAILLIRSVSASQDERIVPGPGGSLIQRA